MFKDPESIAHRANCLEVWGGNGSAESTFAMPGLDVWVWSETQQRSQTGGDVHLLSACASGRITRMLLADICSQGPEFGELASNLRDLMIRNVNWVNHARFVRQMHERFSASSRRGGFATALLSTFFASSKSFTLCNAGHPPPLLYRAQAGEWSVLKRSPPARQATGETPPGVVGRAEYQQFSTRLANGDMVLSYSNVLAECRDSDGCILGVEGLLQRVKRSDPARPADVLSSVVSLFRRCRGVGMECDATLLLCRANDRPVGWKNNLLAPLRLLRKAQDKTSLH